MFAVAALTGLLAVGAVAASASGARNACPVTTPARQGDFNYGSQSLRVAIYWPRGTLPAGPLPDVGAYATVNRDGSISAKVGWWRGVRGTLVLRGRRLDAPAPPLGSHVPEGYGPLGFQPTGLTFPTVGCWRVTGKLRHATLSFVVRVTRLAPRTSQG